MSNAPSSTTYATASAKPPNALKRRQLTAKQLQQRNFRIGAQGEAQARQFLISSGYRIIDSNVRVGNHEVDMIAHDPATDELVFVEVKRRTSNEYAHPSAAVSRAKIRSLQQVALAYRRSIHHTGSFRFDILAILPGTIQQYQNVTWLP